MIDSDPQVEAFFASHCATPGAVVKVDIVDDEGSLLQSGIFSTLAKAQEWADTFDEEEASAAHFSPYIVDEPDFGNVPANRQN